jgi:hypothetical protein
MSTCNDEVHCRSWRCISTSYIPDFDMQLAEISNYPWLFHIIIFLYITQMAFTGAFHILIFDDLFI